MKPYDQSVESALTDLEGILHALDLIRFEDALNKPGPEFHALAVLAKIAVDKVGELRLAIYPNSEADPPCACHPRAAR